MARVRMALSVLVLMVLMGCASVKSHEVLRFAGLEDPLKQLKRTLQQAAGNAFAGAVQRGLNLAKKR